MKLGVYIRVQTQRKYFFILSMVMAPATNSDVFGSLDMNQTASLAYDPDNYDHIPNYNWNPHFDLDKFAQIIDVYNDNLWRYVKRAICGKLGIPNTMGGCKDSIFISHNVFNFGFVRAVLISMADATYSTRRIRRQVCGPNIKAVQQKQITVPVNIPYGLENFLLTSLPQEYEDIPSHFTDFKPLIPVHDPSKYDRSSATLPSLRDTVSENGNLRYWVITNETMWASQHRVMDEFAELMWSQFHWFVQAITSGPDVGVNTLEDTSLSCWRLARSFRRRIVLPEVPSNQAAPAMMRRDLPSLREALLFRPWVFISPAKPDRQFQYTNRGDPWHEMFDEEGVRYPFDDSLFWDPSDEGTWDEEGAPEWVEIPTEKGARK